ncbi:MAG: hypothetical protein WCI02_03935 [Planctomycetota bacterium]
MMIWIFFAVSVAVGFVLLGVSQHNDRKRRDALAELSKQLGLELNWQLPSEEANAFQRFELAHKGQGRSSNTTLSADDGMTRLAIFEHTFVSGSGKNQNRSYYVIGMARDDRLNAPAMSLQPRNWMHSVSALFGAKTVDFPDDPTFVQRVAVKGAFPELVRAFLKEPAREFIRGTPRLQMATDGDTLILIKPRLRLKAENVRPTMDETLRLLKALLPQDKDS